MSIEARSQNSVLSSIAFSQMRLTITRLFSFKCPDTGPDIGSHRDSIDTFEQHALTTTQTASSVRCTRSQRTSHAFCATGAHCNTHPHSYLATDVTIMPAPELPQHEAPVNPHNPHAKQAQRVHWTATRTSSKLQGRHHDAGPTANLNTANITLLPFSTDPYGRFGFFANRLLFEEPKPPDEPACGISEAISHQKPPSKPSPKQ
jgi:hypothetical protein